MTLKEIKQMGQFTCNISHLNMLCFKVNSTPKRVYELIKEYGGLADSVTREAIFSYVTDKYNNGNYDLVYYRWLSEPLPRGKACIQ